MNNIIPMMKYVALTLRHKWFVLLAGIRLKVPLIQLLIHDLSKFSIAELPAYGRQFFGEANDPLGFSYAWNHHQKRNKHHWEYWTMVTGHNRGGLPDGSMLPMPEQYIREMVADWMGASRAYTGKWPAAGEWKWWNDHSSTLPIEAETISRIRELVEEVLTAPRRGGTL